MAAMLTYRTRNSFESRFGRKVVHKKPLTQIGNVQSKEVLYHNEGNKYRLNAAGADVATDEDKEFSVFSAQSYLRYKADQFNKRYQYN
jgi:homoserine O-acetyltransferase